MTKISQSLCDLDAEASTPAEGTFLGLRGPARWVLLGAMIVALAVLVLLAWPGR